ncbi:MAG: PD-(D/E)XK nuclease family protein [Anaerolineaceae bacterium]|nr:PD-(D/E)XK nuclease family protein [Anaerolineaceae bacterium]
METHPEITTQLMQLLQDLLVNNPELEEIEGLLDQFNIFESLGIARQEVRHSNFLAYLLNPRQNHGLGDRFVKRLLQEALANTTEPQRVTPIDLDLWDLDSIDVRREWQSIDVFLLDEDHHLAVIIENKVNSGEHSNQLERYEQIVQQHYPNFDLLCLFLTPDGTLASNENYISIDYSLVCELIEDIIKTRKTTLGRDVLVMMQHYTEMLRRYIVGESEIEKLCQQIYKKHQRALDLIYEYRPDQQAEISEYLGLLINGTAATTIDHPGKTYYSFIPKDWDFELLKKVRVGLPPVEYFYSNLRIVQIL